MAPDNPPIIADATVGTAARRLFWIVLVAAGVLGSLAAIHYASMGLTLSHYDARAHLLVARRVFDSLTPGWRQLGGTWLPLPHLLNLVPVAWDVNYRTGASAVVLSIAALGWGLASFAGYVRRQTGSAAAAVAAALLILGNPNVLYLQSTPMTEPLLIGLSLAAVVAVDRWTRDPCAGARRHAGLVIAALVLTRYEGWLVATGLIALGGAAVLSGSTRTRTGAERRIGAPEIVRLAAYPAPWRIAAILRVLSWASTGRWLITSGFFEANNPARHQPLVALEQVTSAAFDLAGPVLIVLGIAGAAACGWRARRPAALSALLPLALLLPALLPFSAFDAGHPYRVRYMVPLVAACGALSAFAIGLVPARGRTAAALAIVAAALTLRPPLDAHAPMVLEAQRESPTRDERRSSSLGTSPRRTTARPSWRAWIRWGTTCRRRRPLDSPCATSCTRATATCGSTPSPHPPGTSIGCSSRNWPKAATSSQNAHAAIRCFSQYSPAWPRAEARRVLPGIIVDQCDFDRLKLKLMLPPPRSILVG